ncbi:negative regulator of flagellin synthesis FlgM [Sphingomonas jinjuensis]|uniref:Negative regulator of flagellin synthesis n=1 Tax=Sphingomonas jinjuensis TaxID=535907 RepID=A0A840EZ72_9SPHN|nr:flagellar biosynthesis anti-sigma factor FlgM [Sphingomonas jinjuensis]MBB4152323.1 negative regulator of flagellin synthesis FlgM [Sphingomonas jinjuensis]
MVESIGISGVKGSSAPSRVSAIAPSQPIQPAIAATEANTPQSKPAESAAQLSGLARTMSMSAPVEVERVAQIKAAIANGTFPILPSTIADRLLALRQGWNPND